MSPWLVHDFLASTFQPATLAAPSSDMIRYWPQAVVLFGWEGNGCDTALYKLYKYKLSVLVHRCLNGAAPQYLSELIQPLSDVDSRRWLRSASTAEVLVPATWRSTIGDRAFAVAGPRAWNNLPVDLRLSRTFTIFKTHLKSHLFNLSFPSVWLYYSRHH